jgi:hypothetical protein
VAAAAGVRLRLQAAAETAPFSPVVFLSPAPFLFRDPAAASRAQPGALVELAAALPPVEQAEWDVAAVRPQAAEYAVGVLLQAAERAVALQQAEAHAVAVQRAVAHAAAPQRAVAQVAVVAARVAAAAVEQVAEVRRLAAPVAPVALPSAAPWEAAWAFHRDQPPPWPAPRPAARSARATEPRPVAAR